LFDVDRTPVAAAATVIEAVATESLAVAFAAWAQRMAAAYLRHAADRSDAAGATYRGVARSEEHTCELQSRFDIVCSLMLEKKKAGKSRTRVLRGCTEWREQMSSS